MRSMKRLPLALVAGSLLIDAEAALSTTSSLRATSRNLQDVPGVELIQPGDGVHTVRVSQVFIGSDDGACENVSSDLRADILFAIYLDPDTLEETCGIFQRNVTACYQETVAIGCDPLTNTAKIDVYVRDTSFKGFMQVENPMLGRCKVGQDSIARKTIMISETFDCEGPDGVNPNTCSETHDECFEGSYCNFSEVNGYECKSYVPVGALCGGFTIPGEDTRCNPDEAYCRDTEYCIVADKPGRCAAYFGDCETDSDCSDPLTLFCAEGINKCKERLQPGECCAALGSNSCGSNSICRTNEEGGIEWSEKCWTKDPDGGSTPGGETPCDPPCPSNEECAFSEMLGDYFCRPFLEIGDECGLIGIPGSVPNCNHEEAFCDLPKCYSLEAKATCVAYTSEVKECASIDDCPAEDSWCDKSESRCKPKKQLDACCQASGECLTGLTCIELWFIELAGPQSVCRPVCETTADCPEGEWCAVSEEGNQFCKPYAEEGKGCEFYTMASYFEICDPSINYCRDDAYCIIADGGGSCEAFGASCTATTDCEDPVGEYCDTSIGFCKARQETCCNPDKAPDQCSGGAECKDGFCDSGGGVIVQPPVELCNDKQVCSGIGGFGCVCECDQRGEVALCIDDPSDDCDPSNGGADCGGVCTCATPEE